MFLDFLNDYYNIFWVINNIKIYLEFFHAKYNYLCTYFNVTEK